jgi:hypothetical protein
MWNCFHPEHCWGIHGQPSWQFDGESRNSPFAFPTASVLSNRRIPEPLHHRGQNTLMKLEERTPNPLARG